MDSVGQVKAPAQLVSKLANTKSDPAFVSVACSRNTRSRLLGEVSCTDCVVAMTGAEDWLSDGKLVVRIQNGHPLLGEVTGSGCVLGSSRLPLLSVFFLEMT